MKYVDIHCHINFPDYDNDLLQVIDRAEKNEVGMIIVGTDIENSKKAIEIAEGYDNTWATVAIHPNNTRNYYDLSVLDKLAENNKVVGIGECGLDYFHSEDESDIERQKDIFVKHINIANRVDKPLMLHIRNGKNNNSVYQSALKILREYAKVRSNFHFFAGDIYDLKGILDINATVSFTGVLTFTHDYDELVRYAPIENIMSETDAPYVSPVPYRGRRNEPSFVKEIVKSISNIKGESLDKIELRLIDNARKIFRI